MMGGQSSKNNDANNSPQPQPRRSQSEPQLNSPSLSPPLTFEMSNNSMFTSHLSSYEAACRFDPSLRAFDEAIQQRTLRALGTLRTGVEGRSLSLGSLTEITECLQDMELEAVQVILDNKEGVWKSRDMSALVEQYFENSKLTLDFCTSLERCLKRAATSQLVIRAAVSHYEEELIGSGSGPKSFERTVRALESFKAAGDPFTEEFFAMLRDVLEKQTAMLARLARKKSEIDKRLKSVDTWRRVSNVIFVAVFVSVLVCSVVVAALAAPPVVIALVSALAVPIGSVGKWCSSLWNRYSKALKGKREMIDSVLPGLRVTLKDLQNIRVLVDRLEDKIRYLTENVEFALREEGSMKVVMEEIKKSLEEFAETTKKLSQQNIKCIQDVTIARGVVVQKIVGQSSSD